MSFVRLSNGQIELALLPVVSENCPNNWRHNEHATKLVVHHKDANKANNRVSNLAYVTYPENTLEGFRERRKRQAAQKEATQIPLFDSDVLRCTDGGETRGTAKAG